MKQEQSDVSAYLHSKTFGRAKAAEGGRELNLSRNLEARAGFVTLEESGVEGGTRTPCGPKTRTA